MKPLILKAIGGFALTLGLLFAISVFAYQIDKLTGVPDQGDFVLGPGKSEFWLNPGESASKTLQITNRLGRTMVFRVEIEDFTGSETGERNVVLLGSEQGPYSLRDYIEPEIKEFSLEHGEKMNLPVKIEIPQNAEPGGLYGAAIITTSPMRPDGTNAADEAEGQIQLVSRVASLFFVRVKGEAQENGRLEKFSALNNKKFYQGTPIKLNISYRNTGNVHLVPYGIIEVKNILGRKIEEIEIEPYFVMPNALRTYTAEWNRSSGIGYYTAHLYLNRGYQNIIDEARVSFWILPWKVITISILILIAFLLSIWWLTKNVEIRRRG